MAYLVDKIGEFQFVTLQGQPLEIGDRVMIDDRNGVDGLEFSLQGRKGEPFQLMSMVDADTFSDAKALPKEYAALQGSNLLTLIQDGYTYPDQVKVLGVRAIPGGIRRIAGTVGKKISTSAQGWCVCVWDLVFVHVAEEEPEEA